MHTAEASADAPDLRERLPTSVPAPSPAAATYPEPVVIVIPAFNEAATIADVTHRALRAVSSGIAGTVIVVDDGSTDGTADLAAACGATVLRNPENLGKGASIRRGMAAALEQGAAGIVTLDGDGQHRPEDVGRLIACARAHPGRIVVGSRRAGKEAVPRGRYYANRVADFWISWASGHPIDDTQSGFRLYPADLVKRLGAAPRRGGFVFESEMLIEAGRRGFRTVSIDIDALYHGVLKRPSHFRPVTDITRIVIMVGGKLLRWGMHPLGLWRTLTRKADTVARR